MSLCQLQKLMYSVHRNAEREDLTDAEKEAVLAGNAKRFFRL